MDNRDSRTVLQEQTCVPCRGGDAPLSEQQIAELRAQVPTWRIVSVDGSARLERTFALRDFSAALALANAIGVLAEEQGHHPALLIEWGRLTVTWWTHAIRGLHVNDFIMAARTDALAAGTA